MLVRGLTIAMCLALAGASHAQVPRGYAPPSDASRELAGNSSISGDFFDSGVKALQAKNYAVAEGIFEDVLKGNPRHADGTFLMGVTKMGLSKWDEAKVYLEKAVKLNPKGADPKSRLAVTYVKLGDLDAARAQKSALEAMKAKCKAKCRDAQWIDQGLAMVNEVLPPA
jgi:Tfp pilus assembly protein PilF